MGSPKSLYLHVPFCRHRCGYCNFTLVAGRDHLIESFLEAIEIEIDQVEPGTIQTVFLGGGTPTHLPIVHLERLLDIVENKFCLADDCEFSVEANPSDISEQLVSFLQCRKVNRVSLGVQSFDQQKLNFLERDHSRETVIQATDQIRNRIENFSLDLIFGTPGETGDLWQSDLEACLSCGPTHVSTYSLTIEKGTQFWNRQLRSQTMQADEESTVELYEQGIGILESAGLSHYEISNFARSSFECSHNVNYWCGGEYYGFGPGASRYVGGIRATNHQSTSAYIKKMLLSRDATSEMEAIDPDQRAREVLIFGLRQIKGIDLNDFENLTGRTVFDLVDQELQTKIDQGLLQIDRNRLRLTRKGLLVSDSIWPDFL